MKTNTAIVLVGGLLVVTAMCAASLLPTAAQAAPQLLPPRPSLTPSPTATPVPSVTPPAAVPGGLILLLAQDVAPAHWTIVQWQDTWGDWHDVEGWRTGFTVRGNSGWVGWWVAPADYGTGPFRWTVYQYRGGDLIAASSAFDLPESDGQTVTTWLALAP